MTSKLHPIEYMKPIPRDNLSKQLHDFYSRNQLSYSQSILSSLSPPAPNHPCFLLIFQFSWTKLLCTSCSYFNFQPNYCAPLAPPPKNYYPLPLLMPFTSMGA